MERLEIKLTAIELEILNEGNAVLQLHASLDGALIGQTEIEVKISIRE